jgi:hypothetical protein
MKPTSLAVLAILAASSTASAQPAAELSTGYVSVGGIVSLDTGGAVAGYQLEGGVRLGDLPLYARGVLEGGAVAGVVLASGVYTSARLGLELRHRWVFVGTDVGVRRGTLEHDTHSTMTVTSRFEEGLVVPRVGVDIGGAHLRGRFAAELPLLFADGDRGWGIGVTAGLSYAF